jgi:hypothetical protein
MAGHHLIEAHLAELRRRLPTDLVDEIADGLAETYQRHLGFDGRPDTAAAGAIAEFGDPDTIVAAFARQSPGHRTALVLLATGPAVGACWAATLILGHAWTWPVPDPLRLAFGLALLAAVTALVIAAASRISYLRTRFAAAGCLALIALDLAMIAAAVFAAPDLIWPMAAAIPASLTRLALTTRAVPRILTP